MSRFEILGLIGYGGMAVVHRAYDREAGRVVALKSLHEHLRGDEVARMRFIREVEIARWLDHPNIVRIYDLIETPLSFAMEYIEGRDLKALIRARAPLAADEIKAIALPLLSALTLAHHAGVIHRDLKPQNVLIAADGQVKLLDFGLARVQGAASLTGKSLIVGTPDYLAPEFLTDRHLDPRSDLYSLGVILFELATGALPFSGAPFQVIQRKIGEDAPNPLSWRPELDPFLARVIATALRRDPAQRFQTAQDMAQALTAPSAALAPAPAGPEAVVCPACGAGIASDYPVCLECGDDALTLAVPGAHAVLVTHRDQSPRARTELEQLFARIAAEPKQAAKLKPRPKRPALLLKNVNEPYGRYLVDKLKAQGHQAELRHMGQPNSDLLSSVEKGGFFVGFLGLVFALFSVVMGPGAFNFIALTFAFAFALVLMFGFEYWFSRNVARFYPPVIGQVVRPPAPFALRLMDRLRATVKGALSPKLKRDLQKIFRTGAALRGRLESAEPITGALAPEQAGLVDELFSAMLGLAAEINRIDANPTGEDEGALMEEIEALALQAEQAADPAARDLLGSALGERKARFTALLNLEQRRELLYARLLQASARLETLLGAFLAMESEALAVDQDRFSLDLQRLSTEVEAVVQAVAEVGALKAN